MYSRERKQRMSILDKIQAKKLGITIEEYKEKEQLARAIWCNLLSEEKVIDPFVHMQVHKRLAIVDAMFYTAIINFGTLIYNKIYNLGMPEKEMIIGGIVILIIWFIGKFIIYHHDMKQFEKRVEEIAEWDNAGRI